MNYWLNFEIKNNTWSYLYYLKNSLKIKNNFRKKIVIFAVEIVLNGDEFIFEDSIL
jgi:hypothetical protein